MQEIEFVKMVASGNDFVLVKNNKRIITENRLSLLAQQICARRAGVGADGLLVLEESKLADIKMRVFNPDGSEAEMCGNGARAVALSEGIKRGAQGAKLKIETKAGIIESEVKADKAVGVKLTNPKDIKLDIPIKLGNRRIQANFINTGVPHVVIFVEGLDKVDVLKIGRFLRYHKLFSPKGANVNFVEGLNNNSIKLRTYERGVEDETLACGTGSVASALIFALKAKVNNKVMVHTRSQEALTVYFTRRGNRFCDIWLEGDADVVFEGRFRLN